MASRSLLRCMQQGLLTRHVVPAAASVVTTNHGGRRCIAINEKPVTDKFNWYRMATYYCKYFVALTKDVTDFEWPLIQTPEQIEAEKKQLDALNVRQNNAELLKGKQVYDHEVILEALKIFKEADNWKMVNQIYTGALIQEQMYDYVDPEFLQEVEDWLLATHPRWILYDSVKY